MRLGSTFNAIHYTDTISTAIEAGSTRCLSAMATTARWVCSSTFWSQDICSERPHWPVPSAAVQQLPHLSSLLPHYHLIHHHHCHQKKNTLFQQPSYKCSYLGSAGMILERLLFPLFHLHHRTGNLHGSLDCSSAWSQFWQQVQFLFLLRLSLFLLEVFPLEVKKFCF